MAYYITDPDGSLREVDYRQWQEHESPGNPANLNRCDPLQDHNADEDDPYGGCEVIEHDFTEE